MKKFKIAAIQSDVVPEKMDNIKQLNTYLEQMAEDNIDMVILPEMFNCPYSVDNFRGYSEKEAGPCRNMLSSLADEYSIYLIAGSVPEIDDQSRIFNTSYVFDRSGRQIAKHRKMHLFDIDVKGGQTFFESSVLTAGNKVTVFDTEYCRMGLCVCYDFRFPELSRIMVDDGAQVIVVPGAFNMTTGPAHWDILFRTRALDNQVYTIGVAPARNHSQPYLSWGHTVVVSPWGKVLQQLDEKEGVLMQEIDLSIVDQVRKELPMLDHRRTDLYQIQQFH